ncbi:MAG: DUF996 domain-containing protein [Candidatus Bathyarchaeia archaeon]|jgi:uncharacterized membrane protein
MNYEATKYLSVIGAALIVVGYIIPVIPLIGLIMLVISLSGFATYYNDRRLSKNFSHGFIVCIIGTVITSIVAYYTVLNALPTLFHAIYPSWDGNWLTLIGQTAVKIIDPSVATSFAGSLFISLGVLAIFGTATAVYMRRSLKTLGYHSGVPLFKVSGALLVIGALLTIVGVGFALIWISFVMATIAFSMMNVLPTDASKASY